MLIVKLGNRRGFVDENSGGRARMFGEYGISETSMLQSGVRSVRAGLLTYWVIDAELSLLPTRMCLRARHREDFTSF